eukprot:675026-Pelagomonas_calceolata.AAC.1
MDCLTPPLTRIRKGAWVCPTCMEDEVLPAHVQQLEEIDNHQPAPRLAMRENPQPRGKPRRQRSA